MAENLSAISDTYVLVRAVLGDFNATHRQYADGPIRDVVRAMLRLGKVPGHALSTDQQSVSPAITQPSSLALLIYHAALTFLRPNAGAYSYRTRALSESFGGQSGFLFELENALFELENGPMFYSFQSFYAWLNSLTGLDVWSLMTDMITHAPVGTVSLGPGGLSEGVVPASSGGSGTEATGDTALAIGQPTTGTFSVGDLWTDLLGAVWRCTVAGSPGTWIQIRAATITTFPTTGLPVNYLVTVPAQNWAQYYWDGSAWQPVYLQP